MQPPAAKVAPITMQNPAVQKNGKALHTLAVGSMPNCWANRQLCRVGGRWAWSTPLGLPVVPEV
jgi:hypothetical protein